MTLWQVLIVVLVAWISGALFGVGVKELQRASGAGPAKPGRRDGAVDASAPAFEPASIGANRERVLSSAAFKGFSERLRDQSRFTPNLQALAMAVGQPSKRRFGVFGYWLEALIAVTILGGVAWSVFYFALNMHPPPADHERQ